MPYKIFKAFSHVWQKWDIHIRTLIPRGKNSNQINWSKKKRKFIGSQKWKCQRWCKFQTWLDPDQTTSSYFCLLSPIPLYWIYLGIGDNRQKYEDVVVVTERLLVSFYQILDICNSSGGEVHGKKRSFLITHNSIFLGLYWSRYGIWKPLISS